MAKEEFKAGKMPVNRLIQEAKKLTPAERRELGNKLLAEACLNFKGGVDCGNCLQHNTCIVFYDDLPLQNWVNK